MLVAASAFIRRSGLSGLTKEVVTRTIASDIVDWVANEVTIGFMKEQWITFRRPPRREIMHA